MQGIPTPTALALRARRPRRASICRRAHSDNDGAGDDQHIMPGLGTTDWPALLAALDNMNYAGPRTFECCTGIAPEALLRAMDETPPPLDERVNTVVSGSYPILYRIMKQRSKSWITKRI
jgi:hypothetical protein